MDTKRWIVIFLAVIILSAAVWLFINNISYESKIAVIYQDGKVFREIDLSNVAEHYEISLNGEDGRFNTIYVERGRISMSSASCPDQICVKHSPISDGAQPIVCLPNKVIIQIENSENDNIDTVVR